MRLMMVSQDFPPQIGGIATYTAEVAKRLAKLSDEFVLVAPRARGQKSVDDKLDFRVMRIAGNRHTMFATSVPAACRVARRLRPDVMLNVQWQTGPASLTAQAMGWAGKVFVVAHGRELLLEPWASVPLAQKSYSGLRSTVIRRADGLLPVSRWTGNKLVELGVDPRRVCVAHNGVDPSQFFPRDSDALRARYGLQGRRVVLSVGRLVPNKGFDTMIEALPQVRQRIPSVVYLVVGQGPDRERLERLAAAQGVDDRVVFAGPADGERLNEHYNLCDVFTTISREEPPSVEGFGIVFLEAGACERPVVAGRSGGIPDAVLHGQTGLLVTPGNAQELANAIITLLSDEALARRLGKNARDRVVRELNWDRRSEHIFGVLSGREKKDLETHIAEPRC